MRLSSKVAALGLLSLPGAVAWGSTYLLPPSDIKLDRDDVQKVQ